MQKLVSNILNIFGGSDLVSEKDRLEAFLSAVPGEYCGWASDNTIAYSQGFCNALGLSEIEKPSDIANILSYEDGLMLQSLYAKLKDHGTAFTINVQNRSETNLFKISGTCGRALEGEDVFYILWLEDMSDLRSASEVMEEEHRAMQDEMDMLQDSLDALPHPVWIRDSNHKITWCNVMYAKIINAKPSEIISEQKEIVSADRSKKPSDKDKVFGPDLAKKSLGESKTQIVETHVVIDGKRLLLKISEIPIIARGLTVGMAEDLTEEERILDEVKSNQGAHLSLLEQLRSAIAIFGADQSLQFYNGSYSQLWDLDDGWLNTKPKLGDIMEKLREMRRLPEQADFRGFKKSWINMFTDLIDPYDDMLYLPDGSALRMLVVPHKLGGLMMIFEDVTSRLELESSYNTLIAVQKETLDNLAEAVAVFGGDGRLRLWNPSFAKLWDLEPEDLDGDPHVTRIVDKISHFFDDNDWIDTKNHLISLALDRSMNDGRLERLCNSLVDYATVPLPDGGVLVTYSDVTDSVRVENALREKNAALETAEKLKLDFLANVSYQLRTPLNAIMGFNEILEQEFFGSLNEKQKEYTRDIHGASDRLLSLINDILDLSTIEAGQMDLDIKETAVKSMMESIDNLVKDWARKSDIEVTMKCPANIGKMDVDETRIKQAVINLVRNAISSSEKGGAIEVRASRQKNMVKFSVQDSGTGIAIEDQKRILKPFERIDGAQIGRGAGLGLSLVKNIVYLHNGEFDLSSEVGCGTTVSMLIPRVKEG